MTVEEHIQELVNQAKVDLGASEALAAAGYYGHSLFFAHLVLEKLSKALWVKTKNSNNFPLIHNLVRLLTEACAEITTEQMKFYAEMNFYQAQGRYPETLKIIEEKVTKEIYEEYYLKIKSEITCLTKQLQ